MRHLTVGIVFLTWAGLAFGQRPGGTYSSLGGFGNVLYPGTGHAPHTPPGGINGPYFNSGARFGRGGLGNPSIANHPDHRRTVIVPYPVYYGGGLGYGYETSLGYPPGYAEQPAPIINNNAAPPVVINQNFVPPQASPTVRDYTEAQDQQQQSSGLRLYQTPPTHPYADTQQQTTAPARRTTNDDQPTVYLIAFKNRNIVQALGYWMEGSTLHYVSAEHTLNQVSMDLVDRELSQRLNDERSIEFKLPQAR